MPSIGPPPEGFPPLGGSCPPQRTDEGKPCGHCSFSAGLGSSALIRRFAPPFPSGGRLLQPLVRLKQLYRLIHCRGQRAVIFQHDGGGGLIQRRALGFKLL